MYTSSRDMIQQRRPAARSVPERRPPAEEDVLAVKMDEQDTREVIQPPEPRMRATYIRVAAVEIIVLMALWALSRAFGG